MTTPNRSILHIKKEIGAKRSHKEYFIKCRDSFVNETAHLTNALIIRLDKIMNECPSDPGKRKDFERSVVEWAADTESPICRSCAVKFGITRRRHHCRLCGRVMCHNCSRSLPLLLAKKLTSPPSESSSNEDNMDMISNKQMLVVATQKTTEKMKMFLEGTISRLNGNAIESRIGSLLQQVRPVSAVLNNLVNQQETEEFIRVCPSCLAHLSRREQMMKQSVVHDIVEQYAAMDRLIAEASALAPNYARIAFSLRNGEKIYTIRSAEELKNAVLQRQKAIDEISKRLVAECEQNEMLPKEIQLRKNIRYMALLTLQNLSTSLLTPSNSNQSSPMTRKPAEEGWTPAANQQPSAEVSDNQHPLKLQRDIIRSYLTQAAAAGRADEVDMLERNLRDLEEEMERAGII